MNKATIFDYVRLCKYYEKDCRKCPLHFSSNGMRLYCGMRLYDENGILNLCPKCIATNIECFHSAKKCAECCKNYWLAEVEE